MSARIPIATDDGVDPDFLRDHGFVYAFHQEGDIIYALVYDPNQQAKLWRIRRTSGSILSSTHHVEYPKSKFKSIEHLIAFNKLKQIIT